MNWPIFALFAFVMLVFERGLHLLLAVGGTEVTGGVSPSFMLILLVYVGMFAPPMKLAWAAIALGVLLDVTYAWAVPPPVGYTMIIGPHALGFLVGAYTLTQLRAMIFRGSPLTMAVVVFLIGIFVSLVTVFLLRLRGLIVADAIVNFSAIDELVHRFLQLLYTAAAALPVGLVLSKFTPLFAFQTTKGHR
jgi:rod shape-determining protein MreD